MDKEHKETIRPVFWFDKDGVLAKYDYSIYLAETGSSPPWLTKNAHVYRHLPANKNMLHAFRELYGRLQEKPPCEWEYEMKVLTSVSDSVTLSEQVLDSWHWLHKKIPEFKQRDFYAVAVPKQELPVTLRRYNSAENGLTKADILIDDYNKNLEAWEKAGGTAVKALNGINSENKKFYNMDITKKKEDILETILQIRKTIAAGNLL